MVSFPSPPEMASDYRSVLRRAKLPWSLVGLLWDRQARKHASIFSRDTALPLVASVPDCTSTVRGVPFCCQAKTFDRWDYDLCDRALGCLYRRDRSLHCEVLVSPIR